MTNQIDYEKIGSELGRLVKEKNIAYGNSFHECEKIINILYPNGIPKEGYKDLLIICRIIDKLFRLANDPTYGDESPYRDIGGYSLLGIGSWESKVKKERIDG